MPHQCKHVQTQLHLSALKLPCHSMVTSLRSTQVHCERTESAGHAQEFNPQESLGTWQPGCQECGKINEWT
jgi:hypothetical protein